MKTAVIATNKEARHNYTLFESLEAGVELKGCEVKSLRGHRANLKDSFARIDSGQAYLYNVHISPYKAAGAPVLDPKRTRRLLLHKSEIKKLVGKLTQKGFTLIPLKLYFKRGKVKVEIALARGRRLYDKREAIRRRETQLEIRRALKKSLN